MESVPTIPHVGLAKYAVVDTPRSQSDPQDTHVSYTRFLESGEFADFAILCGPYEFKTHKLVLCAESRYFQKLCTGPFKVSQTPARSLPFG